MAACEGRVDVVIAPCASPSSWPLRRERRKQAQTNYGKVLERLAELEARLSKFEKDENDEDGLFEAKIHTMAEMEDKIRSMDLIQEEMLRAERASEIEIVKINAKIERIELDRQAKSSSHPEIAAGQAPAPVIAGADDDHASLVDRCGDDDLTEDIAQGDDDLEEFLNDEFEDVAAPNVSNFEHRECECDDESSLSAYSVHQKMLALAMHRLCELEPYFGNPSCPQKILEMAKYLMQELFEKHECRFSSMKQVVVVEALAEMTLELLKRSAGSAEDEPPDPEPLDKKSKKWTELEDDL